MAVRKKKIFTTVKTETSLEIVGAVHYYRAALPLQTMEQRSGRYTTKIITDKQFKWMRDNVGIPASGEFLTNCDLFLVSRLYERRGLQDFVDSFRERGIKVVFDTDDDLTDEFRVLGRGADFLVAIKAMDHVTVSTPYLAKRLESHLGYTPDILYNHVDFDWFSRVSAGAKRLYPPPVIGFIGTKSHTNDWVHAAEAMTKIVQRYPGTKALAIGYMPDNLKGIPGIEYMKPVPYMGYPAMMRQLDIVLCTLDEHDIFNHSKSAIKAIEAMSAARRVDRGKIGGAVPICTDMKVYRRVVNNGQNGLLTDNSDWYSAIQEVLESQSYWKKLSMQGHRWAKRNRDIATGYRKWEQVYNRLLS